MLPSPTDHSPYVIRAATPDELDEAMEVGYTSFSERPPAEQIQDERSVLETDRVLVAVDADAVAAADAIVGIGMALSFELTVPGGVQVPAAGITWIGVLPTHRRRGILRALIARQLDDVAARGEPVAVLLASEATIYGRFGYGMATRHVRVDIDTRRSAFHHPPAATGRIRMAKRDEAAKVLPAVFDRYRRSRAGEIGRGGAHWSVFFGDREHQRGGASAWFFALHEADDGEVDGYAAYRVKEDWTDEVPKHTMTTAEVVSADPEVDAALWRFLLDIDLVVTVQTRPRPADDPLRWRFVDERCYRTMHVGDWLWLRIVDIEAALSARRYDVTDHDALVFSVDDPFRPANSGHYRLDVAPDGATCVRVSGAADSPGDLALDVADLGSLYLGGVRASTLAVAGRIRELRPGALARADQLFTTHPEPICSLEF